jgi:hypothetical protein
MSAFSPTFRFIRNKLQEDDTLVECSDREVDTIMELLQVCLKTTYFQSDDKFFQQKEGVAMGSCVSVVVSNIFMEHFKKLAPDMIEHNRCGVYVDDTFVI